MIILHLFLFVFVFISSCLGAIDLETVSGEFRNVRVLRVLDLSTSVVKESLGIRVKNTGSQATDSYYYTIPAHDRPFLSIYTALRLEEPKAPLEIEPLGLDTTGQVEIFKIHLNTSLEPESEMKLGLDLSYTHWIRPLPEKIPQIARQHVTFTAGNIYLFSPYASDDMKTTFKFPNAKIITYVGGEPNHVAQKTGNKLIYGVYNDIKPFSFGASNFHYDYPEGLLTVTELNRELQVSHWGGKLAVNEEYHLRHDGAQLIQGYSQILHQQDREVLTQTNVQGGILYFFHKKARDIYYNDAAGNNSKSKVTQMKNHTVVATAFRYPLFGGWKVDWTIGYNAPLRYFLHKRGDRYILKIPFFENAQNMAFEQIKLNVILPEGATDIEVSTPPSFNMSYIGQSTHFTYFDSTGRPVVVIHKNNAVAAHQQPILISYKYSLLSLFQKPLVLSLAIFVLCLVSILRSKMTWTIGDIEEEEEEEEEEVDRKLKEPNEDEKDEEEKYDDEENNDDEEKNEKDEEQESNDEVEMKRDEEDQEDEAIADLRDYVKGAPLIENELPDESTGAELPEVHPIVDIGKSTSVKGNSSATNRKKHGR